MCTQILLYVYMIMHVIMHWGSTTKHAVCLFSSGEEKHLWIFQMFVNFTDATLRVCVSSSSTLVLRPVLPLASLLALYYAGRQG